MTGTWIETETAPDATMLPSGTTTEATGGATGIDQLAFLVGGTWVSVSGGKTAEETCTWGAGNKSIRTVVVFRAGATVIGGGHGRFDYDPFDDKLLSHSNLEQNGVEQLMFSVQVPPMGSPNVWHFKAIFLTDAGVQHMQMTLNQLGPNQMRVDQYQLKGGKPVLVGSASYTRMP
ncbi:MAG TPA: hypothetical protein VF173_36130 [Thermoanaerobaculia bacterium]|nr:hypothetical protein [Thermoanaerobaculia bacterium]